MAGNNDTAKVFISFAGKSIVGLADRPKLSERPSRVSTTFGCQGYSESQQEYEGDRSFTISVFRTGDGYKYLEKCYENRTRGGWGVRDTNPDIAKTYKVDIAQVKSIPEITFGSNDAVEIVIECCTEVESQ